MIWTRLCEFTQTICSFQLT